jgi:OPA family glycerol-3-phosphate transporter-like MFS transporter
MIASGIAAGIASDLIFKGRRSPIVIMSFILQILGLGALSINIHNPWVAVASIITILSSIQLAHGLMAGTAPIEFGGRKAAATATGLIDGAQYLAGSMVGYGMGRWLDVHKVFGQVGIEFQYWPLAAVPAAFLGVLMSLWFLMHEKAKNKPASLI